MFHPSPPVAVRPSVAQFFLSLHLNRPMNIKSHLPTRIAAALLSVIAAMVMASQSAYAGTLYWEPTGTTGTNASGTWTNATTTLDWTTDSTGVSTGTSGYVAGSDFIFSADSAATGASTVTLAGGGLSANSMTFGNSGVVGGTTSSLGATGNYTFTNGQTLTLGNATTANTIITMAAGAEAVTLNGPLI